MLVRADSAGASHGFVATLREEAIMFSVGFPVDLRTREPVLALPTTAWIGAHPARRPARGRRGGQAA